MSPSILVLRESGAQGEGADPELGNGASTVPKASTGPGFRLKNPFRRNGIGRVGVVCG